MGSRDRPAHRREAPARLAERLQAFLGRDDLRDADRARAERALAELGEGTMVSIA